MTTNDSDLLIGRIGALDLRDKAGSTDNVEGSNTKEALRVVDTLGFEDLLSSRLELYPRNREQ